MHDIFCIKSNSFFYLDAQSKDPEFCDSQGSSPGDFPVILKGINKITNRCGKSFAMISS